MKTVYDWRLGSKTMENDNCLFKHVEVGGKKYLLIAHENASGGWVCSINDYYTASVLWGCWGKNPHKTNMQSATRYCDKVFKEMLTDGKLGPVQLEVPGAGASDGLQAALPAL